MHTYFFIWSKLTSANFSPRFAINCAIYIIVLILVVHFKYAIDVVVREVKVDGAHSLLELRESLILISKALLLQLLIK